MTIGLAALCAMTPISQATGQASRSRSRDYLFVASADDARALWVNPAGLGARPAASIMGEFTFERVSTGDLRLGQWAIAFNSRGLSLGYQRDRFTAVPTAGHTFRLGMSAPFPNGAVGGALSLYRGGTEGSEFAGDLGLYYEIMPPFAVGAVVRNIGHPVVRTTPSPLEGAVGAAWIPVPGVLELAADATVREGLGTADASVVYQAGLHFSPGFRVPVSILSAVELESDFGLVTWLVGVTVGRVNRALALVSGGRIAGGQELERLSVGGIAAHGVLRAHP